MTTALTPTIRSVETMEPRYTHEDFMYLAPQDHKAELIDGEIIIMSPAFEEHERLQSFLFTVINFFVNRFGLGQVRGSRTAVYISETDTYEPDILFVSQARKHIITRRKLLEAPDLVVEILSASTARHDRGTKRENYSRVGVRELWLIDPYGPAGTQFFQRQGEELVEVTPDPADIIHSVTLSDFNLKTAWLWPNEKDELPNPIDVLKELGAI